MTSCWTSASTSHYVACPSLEYFTYSDWSSLRIETFSFFIQYVNAVFSLLLQVTANCICLFFDHYGHSSFHRVLIGYLVVLGQIYPMSVMVLFCLASYTSASLFTATQEQIIRLNYRVPRSMERLASIKERHALVCEATACLTDCFGWSLLLTTTFLFLTIINSFFYFFGEMNDDRVMMIDVLCGTTGLIHLLILSIAAHYICDQAVEVKRSLLKIQNQHNQELVLLAATIIRRLF